MSITSLRISGSGLTAERARLDTISRNIANAQTTSMERADGTFGPYLRQTPIFETVTNEDGTLGGVKVAKILEPSDKPKMVYMPGHPLANAEGEVAMPNVDIIEEMVDMIAATRAYEANIGAANATKSMIAKAIELGQI